VLALIECGDGIDIQVDADAVAELIGDEFGIDSDLSRQR
jgi:hypothetical protein